MTCLRYSRRTHIDVQTAGHRYGQRFQNGPLHTCNSNYCLVSVKVSLGMPQFAPLDIALTVLPLKVPEAVMVHGAWVTHAVLLELQETLFPDTVQVPSV